MSTPPITNASRRARIGHLLRVVTTVVSLVILSGALYVLAVFILVPEKGEEFTVGLRPPQYFHALDNADRVYSDATYAALFGVAHNSGDRIESTLEALVYGADVIEVDVVEIDGMLYSAHTPPLPFLGKRWFRGPELTRVWTAAFRADAIKLDLKETSPEFTRLVVNFINTYGQGKPIIIASRDSQVIRTIQQQAPSAIRLLSVGDARALDSLQYDPSLQDLIDGITVRQSLITPESAIWLNTTGLNVFAWTVNDLPRMNELIGLGVDGITSDNLAILNLLGGQERGEREVYSATPEPGNQPARDGT